MFLRVLLFTALFLQLGIGSAQAEDGRKGSREFSREEAAAFARQRHPGRVLSIRRLNGDKPKYQVKMLSDGDVRVITVPSNGSDAGSRRRR